MSTGIIEYNFRCFRNAIQEVFVARNKEVGSSPSTGHPQMDKLVGSVVDDSLLNGIAAASSSTAGHSHTNGSIGKAFDNGLDE